MVTNMRDFIGNGILVTQVGTMELRDDGELLMVGWRITLRADTRMHEGRKLLGYDLDVWKGAYEFYDSGKDIMHLSWEGGQITIGSKVKFHCNDTHFHTYADGVLKFMTPDVRLLP